MQLEHKAHQKISCLCNGLKILLQSKKCTCMLLLQCKQDTHKRFEASMWSQALRQAEQTQQAAEDQRAKALIGAKAEAWETLARAEKYAVETMQEAQAKAAQMTQQQEGQAKQAAQAQAEASAALDRAKREAAATLQAAQTRAEQMAQQQEAQAKQAADAQTKASAAVAKAEKEAAATLQEAQAKAARMAQQQEADAKRAAEAMKQQVGVMLLPWHFMFRAADAYRFHTSVFCIFNAARPVVQCFCAKGTLASSALGTCRCSC